MHVSRAPPGPAGPVAAHPGQSAADTGARRLIELYRVFACRSRRTPPLIGASPRLGAGISSLSIAPALTVRQRESAIAAARFAAMPMTFLSAAFLPSSLRPGWVQAISHASPLTQGIRAGGAALDGEAAGVVLPQLGFLPAFAAIACAGALTAFRGYRRPL